MDYSSMEEGLGFAIRCVRCGSLLTPGSTKGEATCDNADFHTVSTEETSNIISTICIQ